MLCLLSSGVEDTLPAVNLYTDIQLKVNVSFSCWSAEAAAGWCAGPALAEQLTHSRKAWGLLVRRWAVNNERKNGQVSFWTTTKLYLQKTIYILKAKLSGGIDNVSDGRYEQNNKSTHKGLR